MRWGSLAFALGMLLACTSGPLGGDNDAACHVTDEDRRCTVDKDCVYLGTYFAGDQCCYDPCGGGHAVNRQAIERLGAAREPLRNRSPDELGHCPYRGETKCDHGRVYCKDGLCKQSSE